ncbi:murein hydrolase activator EnvC family protein [Prosthecobacter dejongeii]|uniref:Murein DD-endopeptidase MepM/ murein hydrolase activator NlpD n=1 Tax=Prosthecobacter dejongeii TaxID=48465 RepID=A0A7W7YIH3_9BACT|nr:M23 family metallopeptidase [Prosthecobacter dejongeii]MBB5036716.1 murein DD-endopeptidase MepM/ murein hydrolase activator NlpD [Prosthecobacter dejongeii]
MSRFLAFFLAAVTSASALDLKLPTDNGALLVGDGAGYFQFVDRDFEGVKSTPWEGGQFGFVRDARRIGQRVAFARFHEGMDIKPTQRDAKGNPLDDIHSILPGTVSYVTASAGLSNYGRYIVVQHDLPEGTFYSLYAHLASASVAVGEKVTHSTVLGRMGYTGSGIDQRRAHLHVELNILLNPAFETWHATHFRTPNHHGPYNGMNLLGLDLQALYLAHAKNPDLSLSSFIRQSEAWFELTVPATATMDILQRYPWLKDIPTGPVSAWKIRCTRWGLPVSVRAADQPVQKPIVSWVKEDPIPHYYNTRGLVSNSGQITASGLQFAQLLIGL